MAAYPEIELDIDFTDLLVDVIEGGYDVVVRTGEAGDSRLMARLLGNYRLQSWARRTISPARAGRRSWRICSATPASITNIRRPKAPAMAVRQAGRRNRACPAGLRGVQHD
ncbi:MAG: hypothetical protein WDN69_11775 [Aliidongia sp.]